MSNIQDIKQDIKQDNEQNVEDKKINKRKASEIIEDDICQKLVELVDNVQQKITDDEYKTLIETIQLVAPN